jgi:ankyrin repeat protein
VAANRGHILVVKELSTAGADETLLTNDGWLPLHFAAKSGHWGPIQFFILRGSDINAPLPDGRTPMHLCAEAGMVRTAMLLSGKGADLLRKDNDGRTPLRLVELERTIWPRELNRTPDDSQRELALQIIHNYLRLAYAEFTSMLIQKGDVERLKQLLVEHPALANFVFQGWSPLQLAVKNERPECVAALLDAGANPALRDEQGHGQTSLHIAASMGLEGIADKLSKRDPALLTTKDVSGKTPAQLAEEGGWTDLARALDPNAKRARS